MSNLVFVGGYYVEGLDMDQKGLAYQELLKLSVFEAMGHPAIENVVEYWEDTNPDREMENFTDMYEEEQVKWIEKYIEGDEIFGGRFFNLEYEEKEYLEFIEELEENKKNY